MAKGKGAWCEVFSWASLSKASLGMATLSKLQVGESLLFSGKEIEVLVLMLLT
jgi:hypothetical protein